MADIFVSYAREDRAKVEPFVALLEAQNWTVWWDREINPGAAFSRVIEREISLAKCVVVLWTNRSVSSDWVQAEANDGLERKILIPVSFEKVNVPLIFRQTQSADFTRWPSRIDETEIRTLLQAISHAIEMPVVSAAVQPVQQWRQKWLGLTLIMCGLLAVGVMAWRWSSTPDPPDSIVDASQVYTSILVMPFPNMDKDISAEVAEALTVIKGYADSCPR